VDLDVRPLRPSDRIAWDRLWQGYLTFYETALPPALDDVTWQRFADPTEPMYALGAFEGERLVGICHHVLHRSTWSMGWYAYLEDLFTNPADRGRGAARALIEATARSAREAGATKLYWQTHAGNVGARALYDRVARHEGFVIYEREL
jgi:GNAT superfamily N-acetyltransferase